MNIKSRKKPKPPGPIWKRMTNKHGDPLPPATRAWAEKKLAKMKRAHAQSPPK